MRTGRSARDVIPDARAARRPPRLRARPRLRGARRRAPRLRDREAHAGRHRPARRGARRGRRVKLIFEKSQAGRRGGALPRLRLAARDVPEELRRAEPPRLPELAEPEILRHFTELSTRNFGIDTGFYPLGSCTMKYNPRINERLVDAAGLRASASAAGGGRSAGRARADVAAAGDPRRGDGAARGLAPAGGRLAGRADRPDAHARLLRRSRRGRAAAQDRHSRHGARHESRRA